LAGATRPKKRFSGGKTLYLKAVRPPLEGKIPRGQSGRIERARFFAPSQVKRFCVVCERPIRVSFARGNGAKSSEMGGDAEKLPGYRFDEANRGKKT
jgi:hypothetical protein